MSRRLEITDEQWDAISAFLPGKDGDSGVTARDNRLFVNALMWIAKTGAPWRDLPERFGKWNSVFQRFNRWCKAGVFQAVMARLQDPDLDLLLQDSVQEETVSAVGPPKLDETRIRHFAEQLLQGMQDCRRVTQGHERVPRNSLGLAQLASIVALLDGPARAGSEKVSNH